MSKLFITELRYMGDDSTGARPPIAKFPPVAEQAIAIGAASAQSAATNAVATYVRVCADVACHIAVGLNPTATTDSARLPADSVEYIGVPSGHKIAVIAG